MIVSEINIKLTILGHWGVGKTSIVNIFLGKNFPDMYIPTIGSNIVKKEFKLGESQIKLNIWDIGGQRSFNPLNPVFFSNLDAAFLIFDLSNPKETLPELYNPYLKNIAKYSPNCQIYVIGNKYDLIKLENSETLLNNIRNEAIKDFPVIFVSAKHQNNILEVFSIMICGFLSKLLKESKNPTFEGLQTAFLKSIGKTESELNNLIINLRKIDSNTLQSKITPKIIKKVLKPDESEFFHMKEIQDIKQFRNQYPNLDIIKRNIMEAYTNNIFMISDLIHNLRNTPIDLLLNTIDKNLEDLKDIKDDFELKVNSILKLNRNNEISIKEDLNNKNRDKEHKNA